MHTITASNAALHKSGASLTISDPGAAALSDISRVIADPSYLLRGNPDHPEHDELGLRNATTVHNPELVLIGGGRVYGTGVGAEECWPARLNERLGGGVLNAGLPGWGSVQYALIAEELSALAPNRMIVCLNPSSDITQALHCARVSAAPLARSFFDPAWADLPKPDDSAMLRASRAIDGLAAKHPGIPGEDILAMLSQRGEPDMDLCTLEASRFFLAEHSLLSMLDMEHPAIEAGVSITVNVLSHLKRLSEERGFSLTIMLLPTREFLVYQRLDEAVVHDREALERLGLAEASVLGELRAACAGMSLRCFDLTNYLKHFAGSRIYAQNSRQGQFTAKGCELLARFVRERILPGIATPAPMRAAVGGAYPMY